MRAGLLRERVRIEEKPQFTDQNEFGEEIRDWTEVATVWAGVEPLRGREFVEAQQEQNQLDVRIRMRYQRGLTIKPDEMRAVWVDENETTHIYDILYVKNINARDKELHLMCKERL